MPADLRPPVRRPTLDRPALKQLQAMLIGELDLLEEHWEERN